MLSTRLKSMVEKLKELARRHVNYGVENRHYATVGAALLWTLQVGLGESSPRSFATRGRPPTICSAKE